MHAIGGGDEATSGRARPCRVSARCTVRPVPTLPWQPATSCPPRPPSTCIGSWAAHNQLYRSRNFNLSTWSHQLLVDVPRRLFNDNALRLAFCVFWGMFVLSMFLAYTRPGFAEKVIGKDSLSSLESDFSQSVQGAPRGGREAWPDSTSSTTRASG